MEEKQRFTEFVTRYSRVVCATAFSATGDLALSEEVAQETFLVAWRKLPELVEPPAMPAWLCGIARNLARNARRRGWRERAVEPPPTPAGDPSPLDSLLAKERDALVGRALARVPAKYREPLVLFYRGGHSVRVVADALGINDAAARQRLARGRRYLRREVDLVERELPRTQPSAAFVAAVVASLGATSRDAFALPVAATSSRAAAALLPTAALCGALAAWSADGPAQAAPPPTLTETTASTAHLDLLPALTLTPTLTPAPAPALTLSLAPAPAPTPAPEAGRSRTLERALAFYKRKQYHSASIELYKVVHEETEDSAADRQLAAFTLGKTLYHLDFDTGALAYFEAIATDPSHRYHRATLRWLGALAQRLPDAANIAALVANYSDDALDAKSVAPVRDELHYLLGRHYMTDPDPQRSIDHLDAVAKKSDRYPDAQFLAAIMHVRANDARPAAVAFKQAVVAGDKALANRARLNLGRLYYTAGDYDRSIEVFDSVARGSDLWSTAMFEASWAYFLSGSPERGLGHLHTLEAPYFDEEYFPEALEVEAIAYFDRCHFDRAEAITREFDERYAPLLKQLTKITRRYADDEAKFYRFARKLRDQNPAPSPKRFKRATRVTSNTPDSVWRLAASALRDAELDRKFAQLDHMAAEIDRYESADAAWKLTAVAVEAMQTANVQHSIAEADAGRLARKRLQRQVADLKSIRADMRRIRIEILNQRAAGISKNKRKEPAPRIYAIDDQLSYWPWQGEYWRDELGRYYVEVKDLCK